MKDLSNLVSSLRQKAEKLVDKQKLVHQEKEKLTNKVAQLEGELTEKEQQITALTDKLNLLKIAGNVENESTKDVKLKINEMVREIDKCIAQISK